MRATVQGAVLSLIVLLSISQAWAHDESMHKAKPTHGRVAAVKGDALTITTDEGQVGVVLTAETKVEQGEKVVGREALTAGTPVDVFGTTVPGQGLVAKEIMVGTAHGEHAETGQPLAH